MMHSLLFRPIPYSDESAASLLIRAAEENGHENVYQLLAGAGIQINEPSLRACLIDPRRYRGIVKSLGLADDAAELALKRVGTSRRSSRRYRSMAIPDVCFRREDARAFCPECLAEAPYWRQQWLVRPFAACAKHQRLVVDHCLSCGKIPALGRGELTRCNHCKISLLGMRGSSICTDSMILVQRMIEVRDAELLEIVLEFWNALSHFDGKEDQTATDHLRLDMAVGLAISDASAVDKVAALVEARLSSLHPRVQMLPFLMGGSALKRFAKIIIDMVPPMAQIGTGLPHALKLSKTEVCRVLGITAAKLAEMIEDGLLVWPEGGGRQRKISITDIEFMLHEFSATERQFASAESVEEALHPDLVNLAKMRDASARAEKDGAPRLTWQSFWRGEI